MTTPLECAARAVAKRNYPSASDADIDEMWEGWVEDARAVLTALREPSDAMTDAGSQIIRHVGLEESDYAHASDAANVWRFMIDAALGEQ